MEYNFSIFKEAVTAQFAKMESGLLLTTKVSKDELWDTYLGSFPEGSNPIFRERTEHDCSCCKQFIRAMGDAVAYVDGNLSSIWDIDVGGYYQVVADALAQKVKSYPVDSIFLHYERSVGTDQNLELLESGETITWKHFHQNLPNKVFKKKADIASLKGDARNNYAVLKRSLEEITEESISIVKELIAQNSLYRGAEHLRTVNALSGAKTEFDIVEDKEQFLWKRSAELKRASGFRNTVIGTLLVDLSEGKDLEQAVASFEAKVAPHNYKRPTALITKSMVANAEKTIAALGVAEALPRRFAVTEDLTINNVLFADRSVQEDMGVLGLLMDDVPDKMPSLDKVEEVSIESFLENIMPNATSVELMLENGHENNLVSLIAPVDKDANSILKWGNNFTWSYNGEVADSMKERVKAAGGKVDGYLRFSIQWNTPDEPHTSDLDAHCRYPGGHIYYANRLGGRHSGTLDVDITSPRGVAVENIIFTDPTMMPDGEYKMIVNNFSKRRGGSFTAEIEFGNQILSFSYHGAVNQDVEVAVIRKKGDELTVVHSMDSTKSTPPSKELWGIPSQKFHKVNMLMHSPNHWDGEQTGNKHYFFMLDKCKNPDDARGFYNEFLSDGLHEHRKVFEVLGSKLKAKHDENQLSGLGFSSTQNNHVIARVKGSFNRTIKVNF